MYLAREGYHVVLAEREHLDILDHHQLVMVLVKHRPVDQVSHVLFVALGEEQHSLGVSLGRASESLSLRVFA